MRYLTILLIILFSCSVCLAQGLTAQDISKLETSIAKREEAMDTQAETLSKIDEKTLEAELKKRGLSLKELMKTVSFCRAALEIDKIKLQQAKAKIKTDEE